ncbi:unnamed protein product [Paramecium primaurelia]|uniref:Uncharacterized protein n=1 Tax=Paramecium primaurelia TaxID=5886 RepID=A0A8S1K6G4_PARPR|nr:unnamed protein product [Paramecium primaurelia]
MRIVQVCWQNQLNHNSRNFSMIFIQFQKSHILSLILSYFSYDRYFVISLKASKHQQNIYMEVEQQQQPVNIRGLNLSRISQSSIQMNDEDDFYGGHSGRSIELSIRECQEANEFKKKSLQIELSIVDYLSSMNIKMKTDPKAKQDRYYSNLRNNNKRRAYTTLEIERDFSDNTPDSTIKSSQLSLKVNSLLERRKTQLSFASTNQSISSLQAISYTKLERKVFKKSKQYECEEIDSIISNQSPY